MNNRTRAVRGSSSFGRLMLLVLAAFLVTGGYMFQRHMSLKLTRRQARQEAELRVAGEERDRLRAELDQLTGFVRLDSIWTANGKPQAPVHAGRADPDTGKRALESLAAGPTMGDYADGRQ